MFEELIGNKKNKCDLETVLKNNKVSHSYLFIGNKGIGKSLFAKEFAKGILCLNEEKHCRHCKSCIEFDNNNHPDYNEITLGDDTAIKIDTVRAFQKKVQELPIVSNKKVYIIDDSEYMTKEAQNCLLKTIEEPPEFVTIILITSNENKILNTIKSRCIKVYFNNIEDVELSQFLKDKYKIENVSDSMLKAYNGSIGKAIKIHENESLYSNIEKVINNLENYNLVTAIKELEVLYKEKENIYELLDYINVLLIQKAKGNIKYVDYIKEVENTKAKIISNCNYDMSIDSLLFKMFK